MSSELAIEVNSLGKCYQIYDRPRDRLMQMLYRGRKKFYKEFWALQDVSFSIGRGESVAIIGQNGSGKSTLLQLVCQTLHPTSGEVSVGGRVAALLELGAGFNPEFTGRENIYLSGLLYGISAADLEKKYQSIVEFSEIGDFIERPVKTYSSGMYVRLAFAIAAHVDADILIIDEALSVGDVRFMQKCMRFLRAFQKRGTLLFVSHDTGAVTNLCDRAIWLDHGKLLMDGPAKGTVEAYLAMQHGLDRGIDVSVTPVISSATPNKKKINFPDSVAASATPSANRMLSGEIGENSEDVIDPRWDALKAQGMLQTIKVFEFKQDEGEAHAFGARGATIDEVILSGGNGQVLNLVHGGELVTLCIGATIHQDLDNLIIGFYFKDRLGQRLFGDNTYLTTLADPVNGASGCRYRASFRFRLPILPVGDYSIDVAIASGSQQDHTQQHWVHDAVTLRATDSTMRYGLVGIPMLEIRLAEAV